MSSELYVSLMTQKRVLAGQGWGQNIGVEEDFGNV